MISPLCSLSSLCLAHRASGSGVPPSAIVSRDSHQQRRLGLLCLSPSLSLPPVLLPPLLPLLLSWLDVDFSHSLKWQMRRAEREGQKMNRTYAAWTTSVGLGRRIRVYCYPAGVFNMHRSDGGEWPFLPGPIYTPLSPLISSQLFSFVFLDWGKGGEGERYFSTRRS